MSAYEEFKLLRELPVPEGMCHHEYQYKHFKVWMRKEVNESNILVITTTVYKPSPRNESWTELMKFTLQIDNIYNNAMIIEKCQECIMGIIS